MDKIFLNLVNMEKEVVIVKQSKERDSGTYTSSAHADFPKAKARGTMV